MDIDRSKIHLLQIVIAIIKEVSVQIIVDEMTSNYL